MRRIGGMGDAIACHGRICGPYARPAPEDPTCRRCLAVLRSWADARPT